MKNEEEKRYLKLIQNLQQQNVILKNEVAAYKKREQDYKDYIKNDLSRNDIK